MKIFYNRVTEEIQTEDEAREYAAEAVDRNRYYIDELASKGYEEIWGLLTEDAKLEIYEKAINLILQEDTIEREF